MDEKLFKPFEVLFKVLKCTGMWQNGSQSWTYFFAGFLFHFFSIVVYLGFELIYAAKAETFNDMIDALGLSVTFIAMLFKWINFLYKIKKIEKSVEHLIALMTFSINERLETRDHIRSSVDYGFKAFKIFWISAFCNGLSAIITTSVSHKLPFKVWFPFETEKSQFGFWIAAFLQVFNCIVISTIDVSIDFLPITFMTFARGLTDELSERLLEFGKIRKTKSGKQFNGKINKNQSDQIVKCIEIHRKIKEVQGEIQKNFSVVILLQGLLSSVILCTCAFTMSVVRSLFSLSLYLLF